METRRNAPSFLRAKMWAVRQFSWLVRQNLTPDDSAADIEDMRFLFPLLGALLLCACSSGPEGEAPKKAPKTPAPISGRQAFQQTFLAARTWAPDAEPILIRSINLNEVKSDAGKAGAWEVTFVSQAKGGAK